MPAIALAEPPGRYRSRSTDGDAAIDAAAPTREILPDEPTITAAWLLGRVPDLLLPWPLLRAGRAGRGPGPDVREAAARLPSGVPAVGDVEVHRLATDFARHGHGSDPRYARLLLHLVWRDDRAAAERGGPVRLAGGGLAPTVALEGSFGSPARIEAAAARGPAGLTEPCVAWSGGGPRAAPAVGVLRAEGRRRLAERVWRAQHLAAEVGWEAAWRTLLDHALASSAGRRQEGAATRVALADATTAALAARHGEVVRALAQAARSAAGRPEAFVAPAREAGLGQRRAREAGWNAMLPVVVALAAAYGDLDLARAAHALIEAWPAPPPYGRTRALGALVGVTPRDALTAQGLLRMQELWCMRGGCGRCPLSTEAGASPSAR